MTWVLVKKLWWMVPVLAALAWGGWEKWEVGQQRAAVQRLQGELAQRDATIAQVREEGKAAVEKAKADAAARVEVQREVVTKWKTKLVQVPIPATCASAVGAAAVNAANIGKLWQEGLK